MFVEMSNRACEPGRLVGDGELWVGCSAVEAFVGWLATDARRERKVQRAHGRVWANG
jgi:hypothetical protein